MLTSMGLPALVLPPVALDTTVVGYLPAAVVAVVVLALGAAIAVLSVRRNSAD